MKKYITYIILGLSLILLPAIDTEAKTSSFRSSGFSSRSSSSSKPSSGFSSSRKPSAVKPSSSGFSSSSSKPNSSGSVSSPKPKSAFEISQQRKAITPPPPKEAFVNDFKKNNAGKYPSTFNTKPSTRPTYIPPVTTYNNKQRQIEYNPQTRSYGFFDDLGKFMVYDAITDLALGAFHKEQTVYVQKTEELKNAEEKAVQQEKENIKKTENDSNTLIIVSVVLGGILLLFLFVAITSL